VERLVRIVEELADIPRSLADALLISPRTCSTKSADPARESSTLSATASVRSAWVMVLPVMRVLDADLVLKKKAAVASDRRCRGHVPLKRTTPQGRETAPRNGLIKINRGVKLNFPIWSMRATHDQYAPSGY
jgi:hypothetical protein